MKRIARRLFGTMLAILMAASMLPVPSVTGFAIDTYPDMNPGITDFSASALTNSTENAADKTEENLITSISGTGCVISYTAGLIYGLAPAITSLDDYVNVMNGYQLTYTQTENGFGTGTAVNVMKDGVTLEQYIIVIFGDVNGDGSVDSIDAGTIVDYENYIRIWDPVIDAAYLKAGDINGDNSRDSLDAGLVVDFENYLIGIDQSTGLSHSSILIFDSNGGSEVLRLIGTPGDVVVLPADPVKEGYTFAGWMPAIPAVMPAGIVTCVAQWDINYYTITFDAAGGVGGTNPSLAYGTIPTPPVVSKTGYTFNGWAPVVSAVTQHVTYSAQWSANTYTVTFNSNGGTGTTANSTHTYDVAANLTPNGFVKTGNSFLGWSATPGATAPDFTGGQSVINLTPNQSAVISLFAVWKVNKYFIIFDSAGGTSVNTIGQNYGTAITPPAPPTKTGYTFAGWLPAVPATMPATHTTCVAQWTINQYTITFDSAGGSAIAAITQNFGSPITAPANPDRLGYTFTGWLPAVPAAMPAQNITCVAQWSAAQSTIQFDSAGGSAVNPITQDFGTVVIPPENPVRTGYTFTGWQPAIPAAMPATTTTCVAQWAINQYTIIFDSAGGTAVPSITQDYETVVTAPASPTKTGYTFAGWLPAIPATMPAAATACVAQWTINQYAITFDAAGGTAVSPIVQDYETVITAPALPTKPGYTFAGWLPAVPATMPATHTTCVAQWTINQYTITFDSAGGSAIAAITQNFGSPITAPAYPDKLGYTFTGWLPAVPAEMPAQNITCVAQWSAVESTIQFDSAGGSAVNSITQDFGTVVIPPENPVRTGYTFTGWQPAIPAAMPATATTCVAQWTINQYTVNFDSAGGIAVPSITQDYETVVTAPASPTKTGYTFAGWLPAVPATMPANTTTCVAQWTINQYTITFDSAGGSVVSAIVQNYETVVTAPAPPIKTGYSFVGWLPAVPATMPAGGAACVAQWTINQYTITFDSAGGSAVAAIMQDYGTGITLPAPPTKTGYTFTGWLPAVPVVVPAESITCVAQWTVNQYTITFDSAGGSAVTAITQNYGTAITAPASPTKTGYTFTGWLPVLPADMPAMETNCVAQWTINQYTIIFDAAGGTAVPLKTQDYETNVTVPAPPTKTGYTFIGWLPAVPATMPVGGAACVAQWTINQYTVTFDAAGGSAVTAITQNYGTAITAPAPPTKTGYAFNGWLPAVPVTMPAGNTTYVAQWTINQYTITFDSAGGSAVTAITQNYGTDVSAPLPPTKTGYLFVNWLPVVPETMPAMATTCVAQWSIIYYTIIFDANGGTGGTAPLAAHGTTPTPPVVTRVGYSFVGWDQTITAATEAKIYTAQWIINQYTITFDTAGGTEVSAITQDYGTAINAPGNPEKTGYTFMGWLPVVPAAMPAGGKTCVAQWAIKQSTISFDSAGGSAVSAITQDYGTVITPPAEPVKTGFTFIGWLPELPATMPATVTNCVAQWTITYYTITFDANGGTGGQTPSVAYGVLPTPPSVKKLGYALTGWSPTLETVTGTATYSAQWEPYDYVTGDIIEHGSYPQTRVTDPVLITALESEVLLSDNTVTYNAEKYKRVYFTQYTALEGGYSTDPNDTQQDNNGYFINTVYWFKFEPVEWRVLSNTDGELLVMAEKILDANQYDGQYTDVTWESCSIRTWLNNDFYNAAFGSAEKARIETTAVENEDNHDYGTLGGNNTYDKLFLLSQSEASNASYGFNSNYSNPDVTREAYGTDYAKCSGLYVIDYSVYSGNSVWWLRSPGYYQSYAGNIDTDGYGGRSDSAVSAYIGVRPAFRINVYS